jgi:hypothetical protein
MVPLQAEAIGSRSLVWRRLTPPNIILYRQVFFENRLRFSKNTCLYKILFAAAGSQKQNQSPLPFRGQGVS